MVAPVKTPAPEHAYERLLALAKPYRFAARWSFLPALADCRQPIPRPAGAVNTLREAFPDEVLDGAELLEPDTKGKLRLNRDLSRRDGMLLGLRKNSQLYMLMLDKGYLPGGDATFFDALADDRVRRSVANTRIVCATETVQDAAILLSLDIPALLCPVIDEFDPICIRKLDSTFGGAADTAVHPGEKPLLVLVSWSVSAVSRKPGPCVDAMIQKLRGYRASHGIDFAGVMIWRLTETFRDRLHALLAAPDASQIRQALLDSTADLDELDDTECATEAAGELSFLEARRRLQMHTSKWSDDPFHLVNSRAVVEEYHRAVNRTLIEPLIAWALAQDDTIIRSAGVALADICTHLHQLGASLGRDGSLAFDAASWEQYFRLLDRFLSLAGTLNTWKHG